MKKSKPESKARIHTLRTSKATDEVTDASEMTRRLFTDTWRSYLDQVQMAAVKLNRTAKDAMKVEKEQEQLDRSKGPVRLYLPKP